MKNMNLLLPLSLSMLGTFILAFMIFFVSKFIKERKISAPSVGAKKTTGHGSFLSLLGPLSIITLGSAAFIGITILLFLLDFFR